MLDLANLPSSRRRALGWLAAGGGAALWPSSGTAQTSSMVVEAESFGKFGDAQGDAAPAINAAMAALVRSGGGTLRFRSGKTYLCDAIAGASARTSEAYRSSIALPPGARNIVFDLNGAIIRQVSDAMTFGAGYRLFNDRKVADTAVPLAASAKRGDQSVRLRASGAFVPGQVCMLLAGNTVPNAYSPIAEMLVVSRVAGDTVWFDRPLRKDYRPRGNTPFGLIDATPVSASNIALLGPGRVINERRRTGNFLQILGMRMDGVSCEGRGGMGLRGRDITVTNCSASIEANWSKPVFRPYCLAFDTGTSDVTVRNFRASGGSNMTYLHLHEGQANARISNFVIENGIHFDPQGENDAAISILGASWNVAIDGATVVNNPQGAAITARESPAAGAGDVGLALSNIVVQGVFRQTPVVILEKHPFHIDGLDLRRARGPRAPVLRFEGNPLLSNVLEP